MCTRVVVYLDQYWQIADAYVGTRMVLGPMGKVFGIPWLVKRMRTLSDVLIAQSLIFKLSFES